MLVEYSVCVAIAAFTYSEILTQPGMILSGPADYIETHFPGWLSKPLMLCSKCFAGQAAAWLYPFVFIDHYDFTAQNIFMHIWFVLQCIFNTVIVRSLYYKITGVQNVKRTIKLPQPPELNN